MFTLDNTDDFTPADIVLLNATLEKLIADGWEEKTAADHITNKWSTSNENTVESLSARAA